MLFANYRSNNLDEGVHQSISVVRPGLHVSAVKAHQFFCIIPCLAEQLFVDAGYNIAIKLKDRLCIDTCYAYQFPELTQLLTVTDCKLLLLRLLLLRLFLILVPAIIYLNILLEVAQMTSVLRARVTLHIAQVITFVLQAPVDIGVKCIVAFTGDFVWDKLFTKFFQRLDTRVLERSLNYLVGLVLLEPSYKIFAGLMEQFPIAAGMSCRNVGHQYRIYFERCDVG